MSSTEASVDRTGRTPVWLKGLYAVGALSALAIALMLLKDLIQAVEGHEGELHDLPIFDIAWPVFVLSWLFTLIAGVVMSVVGAVRRTRPVLRFSAWALGYCLVSALIVAVAAD